MVIENDLLYAVEHGPKGGDELNVIDLNVENNIQNFGWPASYGDHYDGQFRKDAPFINHIKLYQRTYSILHSINWNKRY